MSGNRVVFNDNYQYNSSNSIKEIDIDVWVNNPTILLDKNTIFEIWPTQQMCYERKINAMTRLIILLTILGFILTRSMKIVVVGFITLIVVYLFYYQNWYKRKKTIKRVSNYMMMMMITIQLLMLIHQIQQMKMLTKTTATTTTVKMEHL